MGFFDEYFRTESDFVQQRSINRLQAEINSGVDDAQHLYDLLGEMNERIGKLELLNRGLLEVIVSKGLLIEDELSVMMQQIDLLDGVEDGQISKNIHNDAPSCNSCGRYVNPRRANCVYCGEVVSKTAKAPKIVRMVNCSSCRTSVPESSTYFGDNGVVCESCFESV